VFLRLSRILIIAATVFFERDGDGGSDASAGLFDAYNLINSNIGKGPSLFFVISDGRSHYRSASALVFAVALLCAGQVASITATLAGQIVSEGFIEWRISVRALRDRWSLSPD